MIADEVRRFLLYPFGPDNGDVARVKARGFNQFCRHHPFRFVLNKADAGKGGSGCHARRCNRCRRRFHADVGDEAGEWGAVDLFVASLLWRRGFGAVLFLIQLFCLSLAAKSWSPWLSDGLPNCSWEGACLNAASLVVKPISIAVWEAGSAARAIRAYAGATGNIDDTIATSCLLDKPLSRSRWTLSQMFR